MPALKLFPVAAQHFFPVRVRRINDTERFAFQLFLGQAHQPAKRLVDAAMITPFSSVSRMPSTEFSQTERNKVSELRSAISAACRSLMSRT